MISHRRTMRSTAIAIGLALAATSGASAASFTFYVSTTGSGTTCSISSPCWLNGAQQAVQTTLQKNPGADVKVLLGGGTYRRSSAWTFGPADSGSPDHPVVWQAASASPTIISGAASITGWTQVGATGIWAAPVPSGVPSRQLYIGGLPVQVAQQAFAQTGFTGKWMATTTGYSLGSDSAAAAWFAQVKQAGQLQQVEFDFLRSNGAWTNTRCRVSDVSGTTLIMDQPCWNNTVNRDSSANMTGGLPSMGPKVLPTWIENAYALLQPGQWFYEANSHKLYYYALPGQVINDLDVEMPTQTTLLQVAGSLTAPVHDITFQGLQFAYATWNAPSWLAGFSDVQSNLHMTGTGAGKGNQGMCMAVTPAGTCPWGAMSMPQANVVLSAAQNIIMTGNLFTNLGGAALQIEYGSQNVTIEGNEFYNIASTAILLGCTYDPTPTVTQYANEIKQNCAPNYSTHALDGDQIGANEIVTNTTIDNNLIHNIGTDYRSASAITLLFSQGTTVNNNDIYNTPYTGISAGVIEGHLDDAAHPESSTNINNNNKIANNLIHNHKQVLGDGGAIYMEGHQSTYTGAATQDAIATYGLQG